MYEGFHTVEDVMREYLIQGANLDKYGVPELYPIIICIVYHSGGCRMDNRIKKYFENPRKIIAVKSIENDILLLTFDNGEIKKYNMIDEMTGIFSVLKQPEKFNSVFLNDVGNVAWNIDKNIDSFIHWENQIDLCKDMLYLESVPA